MKRPDWSHLRLPANLYLWDNFLAYLVGPEMDRFERAVARTDMRVAEGIYFLFDGDELVYVGQSVYITERIRQHIRKRTPFTHFGSIDVPWSLSLSVEIAYIHALRPRLNRRYEDPVYSHHDMMVDGILKRWNRSAFADASCAGAESIVPQIAC
jgi:hypothetical protein